MKITRKNLINLIKESLEEIETPLPVCAPGDVFNHVTGEPCDPNEVDAVDSPIQDFIDADSEKQDAILQQLEATYDLPFTNRDIRMLIFSYVDKFDAFSKDASKISDLSLLNKRVQTYIETIERKYMDLSVAFLSRSTRLDTGLSMFYYNTPDIGKSFHTLLMSRVSIMPDYMDQGLAYKIIQTYIRAGLFVPDKDSYGLRDNVTIKDLRKQVNYNTKVNSFKLIKAAQTTDLIKLYYDENTSRHKRILQIFDNLKKANAALGAEVDKEYGLSELGSDIASEELSYKLENLYDLAQVAVPGQYNPEKFPYKEFEELEALITAQDYVAASKFCRRLARAVEDKIPAAQYLGGRSERRHGKDELKNGILEFGKELRTYAYPFEIKIKRLLTTLRSNVEGFQSLFENRRRRNRYRLL